MKLVYTDLFNRAWDNIKDQLPLVAGLTLVFLMGTYAFYRIPYIGPFLSGPLTAGYFVCLLNIRAKKDVGYQDFFWAFMTFNRFLHLTLLSAVTGVLMVLGYILFLIPGVWFSVASAFATVFFVLGENDAIAALKKSMAVVKGHWWNVAGLAFFNALLVLAGALCFVIGALIAIPISSLIWILAAEQLAHQQQNPGPTIVIPPLEPVDPVINPS